MERLSYDTLEKEGYEGFLLKNAPERVLQFGEGNFLRAFVEHFIDVMNEKTGFNSKVVMVQPSSPNPGQADKIKSQDGLYTLYLRGFQDGKEVNDKRIISCVSRCLNAFRDYEEFLECAYNPELRFLVSNTTEAGIVYDAKCRFEDTPPSSFPAKLTRFLYERYRAFEGKEGKGFVILSCELIDNNGKELLDCVKKYISLWKLDETFAAWVEKENIFCSTLVDRIVTGYPKMEADELHIKNNYEDSLIDTGEVFGFWVIEGPESLKKELPFEEAGLPVLITDNHKPYKQRKVRILNGAHTSMVLGAYLAGQDIVRKCMEDDVIRGFMNKTIYKEIIPTLNLPEEELKCFAEAVEERFTNPFIDHSLLAIALNSTAKWKARVLPGMKGYIDRFGEIPKCMAASFAFYIAFYNGQELTEDGLKGERHGEEYLIKDDRGILEFYAEHKNDSVENLVHAVCSNETFWGEDLGLIPGFEAAVSRILREIREHGTYEVMKSLL